MVAMVVLMEEVIQIFGSNTRFHWNLGWFWKCYFAGGFGAQQAYNVQNAARIGTEVAEGVLVAEEVSEALGK